MQNRSPFKLLLANQDSNNQLHQRSEEQVQLLHELLKNNKIFEEFNIPSESLKEICNRIVLIWSENPHINEINNNQIYFLLEGKAFQYVQNKSTSLKAKLHQNNDYILVRKLQTNDYFLVYSPSGRYKNRNYYKKYQLMVDQKTLLGKISDQLFFKLFLPVVEEKWKKIMQFMKKVSILESLPQILFYQLSKYILEEQHREGKEIIQKDEKNQNVYFIRSGQVLFTTYLPEENKEIPSKNYYISHPKSIKKYYLKEYDVFGMDAFNQTTYQEQNINHSAEVKKKCSLYTINKKILAIVISSYEDDLKYKGKGWSSINLNEQVQGQSYQSPNKMLLQKNANKIKTSQKKIRDIKLRYLTTSKRERAWNREPQVLEVDDQLMDDVKYRSCYNFNQIKDIELKEKYKNNVKSKFTNFVRPITVQQPTVSRFVFSAFDDHSKTENIELSRINQALIPKPSLHVKRNSMNFVSGKEETDIIRGYIDRRIKNQVQTKVQLIQQRTTQIKRKEKLNLKRVYSLKQQKPLISSIKGQIGEELFERMNKLHENPLLFKVENQRKKLEIQKKKFQERKVKKQRKTEEPNELILIKNN